jgi:hypothetical protein
MPILDIELDSFNMPNPHHLRGTLQTDSYPAMYLEASDSHLPGNWRGRLDEMKVFL